MSTFNVTYINIESPKQFSSKAVECGGVEELAKINEKEIAALNSAGGNWVVNGFMDEFDVNSYVGIDGQEYIS